MRDQASKESLGLYRVEIRHNFETGHRLTGPDAPVKCVSIHGHSWWATVTLEGSTLDARAMLIEFGDFKKAWREYVDDHIDHHLVLQQGDPMAEAILGVYPESRLLLLDSPPTTEALSEFLWHRASEVLEKIKPHVPIHVVSVHVQETMVNAASYTRLPQPKK